MLAPAEPQPENGSDPKRKRSIAGAHRWAKGQTGNPSGRNALATYKVNKWLSMSLTAQQVIADTLVCEDPKLRYAAAVFVIEKVEGKAKQQVDVAVSATDFTAQHLAALRELAAKPLIDVTPAAEPAPCPEIAAPNDAQPIER